MLLASPGNALRSWPLLPSAAAGEGSSFCVRPFASGNTVAGAASAAVAAASLGRGGATEVQRKTSRRCLGLGWVNPNQLDLEQCSLTARYYYAPFDASPFQVTIRNVADVDRIL